MNKSITAIFIIFSSSIMLSYGQDTLYFDAEWKETSKSNHAYYRPLPLKRVGELVLLKDFYKNGNMQMQGYVHANNHDKYVGDIYYYDENGFDIVYRQFDNKTKTKELTYYHTGGDIWQQITYNDFGKKASIKSYLNGKELTHARIDSIDRFSGIFNYHSPEFYYNRTQEDEEENYNALQPIFTEDEPVIDPADEITEAAIPVEDENKKQYYSIITFWGNGRIARHQKMVYSNYYGTDTQEDKYYNQQGVLISNIDKKREHTQYTYYTKNHIAQHVKEQVTYKDDMPNGYTTYFDTKGNITTKEKYQNGELLEVQYFENGKLNTTNFYKDGNPFNGKFSISNRDIIQQFTMENGQKIGEEKTLLQDSTLVASGKYKNGEPWNGSFVKTTEDEITNLLSYKNGVLNGVQKKYENAYLDNLIEEYEMIDGKLNGTRKIYDADSIAAQSIYKDDRIISGTVIEDNNYRTYVDGKLRSERVAISEYNSSSKEEILYDSKGILEKVTYTDFTIKENPKPTYEGIYKDGKPFNGYFKIDKIIDDIKLISYYEKGALKYKYSFDFIEQMDNYEHYLYTDKSTYLNDNIINGNLYELQSRAALIKKNYVKGKLTQFDINLFAMHYFGRFSFVLNKDKIIISEFNSTNRIEIKKENDFYIASYFVEDILVRKSPSQIITVEKSPNSITAYYLEDNSVKKISTTQKDMIGYENNDSEIFNQLFMLFPLPTKESLEDILIKFSNVMKTIDEESDEDSGSIFARPFRSYYPFQDDQYLSFVQYDSDGKIPYGIQISIQNDNSILLEGILDSNIKETIKLKSIKELLADDKKILEDLSYRLLNKY